MKLGFDLVIVQYDDEGEDTGKREPTDEEFQEFLQKFVDMESTAQDDANGMLWVLEKEMDPKKIPHESFDFGNPERV